MTHQQLGVFCVYDSLSCCVLRKLPDEDEPADRVVFRSIGSLGSYTCSNKKSTAVAKIVVRVKMFVLWCSQTFVLQKWCPVHWRAWCAWCAWVHGVRGVHGVYGVRGVYGVHAYGVRGMVCVVCMVCMHGVYAWCAWCVWRACMVCVLCMVCVVCMVLYAAAFHNFSQKYEINEIKIKCEIFCIDSFQVVCLTVRVNVQESTWTTTHWRQVVWVLNTFLPDGTHGLDWLATGEFFSLCSQKWKKKKAWCINCWL